MAKSKPFDMGDYIPSEKETQARFWCMRNDILISPKAITEGRWSIIIRNKDLSNEDPTSYTKTRIWEKVYEYYEFYFKKYENKI